jgi:hypothetical protein
LKLLPDNQEKTIMDGGLCNSEHHGRFILDGFTSTPLVIEYLKQFPGTHNVVVFDNGGPTNSSFRKSITLDENGMAEIRHNDSFINLFVIGIEVEGFEFKAMDKSPEHSRYLEGQVEKALQGKSAKVFKLARGSILQ